MRQQGLDDKEYKRNKGSVEILFFKNFDGCEGKLKNEFYIACILFKNMF